MRNNTLINNWISYKIDCFIVQRSQMVGIFHCARHTFGTLTLEAGVPIESIAKMMGHSSIASTQIYAQVTDQKIAMDMERLMWQKNV